MAVKIRLARRGRKKLAVYNLVVADVRSPRDGRYIENLGIYNPNTNPATIEIDEDKALDWVLKGANPTDTVRRILSYKGIMLRKHLQVGVNKGAITQEEADKRFAEWQAQKDSKIKGKVDSLAKQRALDAKKKLDDEKKKNEARAAEIQAKQVVAAPEASEEVETEVVENVETQETVEETNTQEVIEEAPVAEVKEEVEEPSTAVAEETEEPTAEMIEEPAVEVVEKEDEPVVEVEEEKSEEPKAEGKTETQEKVEEPKAEETSDEPASPADEEEASEKEKK